MTRGNLCLYLREAPWLVRVRSFVLKPDTLAEWLRDAYSLDAERVRRLTSSNLLDTHEVSPGHDQHFLRAYRQG